jgi:hypothetical protein
MSGRIFIQLDDKTYEAVGKYLVCKDVQTGKEDFRKTYNHPEYGTLRNLDIREMHVSPDHKDIVLLLDLPSSGYKTVGNLIRVTSKGEIVWWAELTDTGSDAYVSVGIGKDQIHAQSLEFACAIDPTTGRILSKTFTK